MYMTGYQGGSFYLTYTDTITDVIQLKINGFTIEDSASYNDGGFLFFNCK